MNSRVEIAKKCDSYKKNEIENAYTTFFHEKEKYALEQHDVAAKKRECDYQDALQMLRHATTESDYNNAANKFESIGEYKDSNDRVKECRNKANEYIEEANRMSMYNSALRKAEKNAIPSYREAIDIMQRLKGWKDADSKVLEYEAMIHELTGAIKQKEKTKQKRALRIKIIALAAVVFTALLILVIIPNFQYNRAERLENNGDVAGAAIAFSKLNGYSDAKERSFALWEKVAIRDTISAGYCHTVALKSDGTVVAVGFCSDADYREGERCDVFEWKDIISVAAGSINTIGLQSDGTVVAAGKNRYGENDVSGWKNIVALETGDHYTVGLQSDGRVVACGLNDDGGCDVSDWNNIIDVSTRSRHTVGLKIDGTVVAVGMNDYGQCDVSDWDDIIMVEAGSFHTVGLKSDGTVVSTGLNNDGGCNVSDWSDIIAIAAGNYHTVGLKSDGTVVAVGSNASGQCNVSEWKDIVAVSADSAHTVGLKADGTVVAVGDNSNKQCNVSSWQDIKLPGK